MRFVLVLEVEEINLEPFNEWKLHCTLVPWFEYKGDSEELFTKLRELFKSKTPINLKSKEEVFFGKNKNIAVNLLEKTQKIISLHNQTVHLLESIGSQFNTSYGHNVQTKKYILDNYTPHVTHHAGRKLAENNVRISSNVYLVKSISESPKIRQVVQKYKLGS